MTKERRAVRTRNRKWFFIERWLRGNVRLAENRAIDTDKPAGSAEEIKYVSRRVITGCDQLLCAARTPIAPPLSALRSRLPKATLISSAVNFIYFLSRRSEQCDDEVVSLYCPLLFLRSGRCVLKNSASEIFYRHVRSFLKKKNETKRFVLRHCLLFV